MRIKNKLESYQIIDKLQLNTTPTIIINKENVAAANKFFNKNKAKEYVLRDIDKPQGAFKIIHSPCEYFELCKTFKKNVMIAVSFNTYPDRVLIGDIIVSKRNNVKITASQDKTANHRTLYDKADYMLDLPLKEEALWKVPGIEIIMNCVHEHDLYDVIIEFVIFKKPVGTKKEKLIITELRTNY